MTTTRPESELISVTNTPTRSPVDSAARDVPLRMPVDEFKRVGHALVDTIAESLASLSERPVTTGESPEQIQHLIDARAALPDHGTDADTLLRTTAELLFSHSLFNGHPKFFGYITAAPTHIGILGDLLASAVNPNVGSWRLSPVATEIESQTVRWIAELLGYPTDCGGLMVSGGNMANMVGLFAARAAVLGSVRKDGVASAARPLRIYASAETHTWVQKGTDLAGLGTNGIRWIATDDDQRMNVGALREAIARDRAAGDQPMMIVGTAGSVSTGAIDPLSEIAELCRTEGIWFHVDGAYGAFAAAVPDAPDDLRALRLADSVAVDPHKWLYAPLEAGCVLVRDAARLRDAFSYRPPYYHFGQEPMNYVDIGPQNSRGFRALKVWLALRQAGRSGYVQMIRDDIQLSRRFYARVREHEELEALTQSLSINTFRYVPADLRSSIGSPRTEMYLNALNEQLNDVIQRSGDAFVSNAVIRGKYALRACIVNFNTRAEDVDVMPEIVARAGRRVDSEIRPPEFRV